MSCRSTRGGTLSTRLARLYSGLTDKQVQALFHSLKREGKGLPEPTEEEYKTWRSRQQALIQHAPVSEKEMARMERLHLRTHDEYPDGPTFHAWQHIEVRARQEAVMSRITDVVDLAPPGSQADQYQLDDEGRPTHVWYASYGSNLNRDRFLTYLRGGTPPGGRRRQTGARDTNDPKDDIPIRFDGRMHFAYASGRWDGGGVGFMDVDKAGHALGRAYLITAEQFDDVVAQENGFTASWADPVDFGEVISKGRATYRHNVVYSDLIHIGDHNGAPVITFTGSFTSRDALLEAVRVADGERDADTAIATNEPHGNYLRMIGAGLSEAFGMSEHDQADYLRGCGGAETWPRRALLSTLRADEPIAPPPPPLRPTPAPALTPAFSGDGQMTMPWTFGRGAAPAKTTKPAKGKTTSGAKPASDKTSPRPATTTRPARADQRVTTTVRDPGSPLAGRPVPSRVLPTKRCPLCGNLHSMHECPLLAREND
jgi:hypothetical protein